VVPPAPHRVGAEGPRAVAVDALDPAALLVDVRAAAASRLPGARLLAPVDTVAFVGGLAPGRPVVVVCEDGERSAGVAERLAALGVPAGWLAGGVGAWVAAGRPVEHT
jgi:rhodanese-related sulfurtransferase